VQEKLTALRPFAESLNFVLEEYAGGRGPVPVKKRKSMRTLYLATIEKANIIITSLFEQNRLPEIGLFVIDELHMIGDGTARGVTLETLIVKTKLAARHSLTHIRFLGMSATLSNFNDLRRFLDAEIIKDNFRPVQLKEMLKIGPNLYDVSKVSSGHQIQDAPIVRIFTEDDVKEDPDHLRLLVGDMIPAKSVLLFCPVKKQCEDASLLLTRILKNKSVLFNYKKEEKERLIRCISKSNGGTICSTMRRTLPFGIVYHHSGLTPDERQMIEEAFLRQIISCIVCTSTLAAGVNLPAERVIIRSPHVARDFISKSQYQQMCGRAGRAGLCSSGESILIGSPKDAKDIQKLLETGLPACTSALIGIENGMSSFILTLVRLGFARSIDQLNEIITQDTLSGIQHPKHILTAQVSRCVQQLKSLTLMTTEEETGLLRVSSVGSGVVRGLIDVEKSVTLYGELQKAQTALSLSNLLHLIYLTTLLLDEREITLIPGQQAFLDAYDSLTEGEKTSAEMFGLHMGVVSSYLSDSFSKPTIQIRRYYVTLIAYEVWKRRTDIPVLADKYDDQTSAHVPNFDDFLLRHNLQRGTLFSILNQTASSANSLQRFVQEIGNQFWSLVKLLPDVCNALTHCCVPELLPLMELPGIRTPRARQLFAAGFKDIASIAKLSKPSDLTDKVTNLNKSQAIAIVNSARHYLKTQKDELSQQMVELEAPAASESEEPNPADDSFLQNFEF
jgi:POLQ-like helicase